MNDAIKQVVRIMIQRGVATPYTMRGCTDGEVEKLEKHFNIKLPSVYRDFLLAMGHGAGSLYTGTHFTYEHLFELRGWAEELLADVGPDFYLPDDAFVFLMHQGYDFLYFQTSEGDDPPVYEFLEWYDVPTEQSSRLSAFLLLVAQEYRL
jgi:hypothetical protein